MSDSWKWPEDPQTIRDLIAAHYRNWGRDLAYANADQLIALLESKRWKFIRRSEIDHVQGNIYRVGEL